jgi:hypothetical protein
MPLKFVCTSFHLASTSVCVCDIYRVCFILLRKMVALLFLGKSTSMYRPQKQHKGHVSI